VWTRPAGADRRRLEVAFRADRGVLVRYSRYPQLTLTVPRAAWLAFLRCVKAGDFDGPPPVGGDGSRGV
jgi:Domain of unknown function (DUF397)